MVRIVKIKGFAFETADDIDIDLKIGTKQLATKAWQQEDFSLYFHTIRRKEKGFPDGEMPDNFQKS